MFGKYLKNKKTITTITTILILTTLILTPPTPTHAQTQNQNQIQTQTQTLNQEPQNWKQEIRQKGFIKTGPHGLAIDTWTYLLGETQSFIKKLTLNQELNQTKKENTASIHGHALTIKQAENTTQKIQKNHIHDARNLVWAKIKKATIKALNNGKTKQYTKTHTKQIIQNYYSTIQYNLNQHLNTETRTIKHLQQKNQNTTTLYKNQFQRYGKVTYRVWSSRKQITKKKPLEFIKRNITLLNNTKQTVMDTKDIHIPKQRYSHGAIQINPIVYSDEKPVTGDGKNKKTGIRSRAVLEDDKIIIDANKWHEIHQILKQENQRMIDNAKKYIEGIYKEYEEKQLTTKDLIDASTLVSQLNTEINKTGYFGYSNAKLALLGINTSLEGNIKIELVKQNQSLRGMLFTDHSPRNQSFKVGEKYCPSNWSEPCYFLGTSFHTLNQPFIIKEIKGYNDKIHQKLRLNNYNRQTLDPNKTITELKQLNKLYNQTKVIEEKNINNSYNISSILPLDSLGKIKDLSTSELRFGIGLKQKTLFLLIVVLFLLAVIAVKGVI